MMERKKKLLEMPGKLDAGRASGYDLAAFTKRRDAMRKYRTLALSVLVIVGTIVFDPGALWALGSAPFPTGKVEFDTYQIEPDVVRPGEVAEYVFSWNGFDAARATISVTEDPNRPGWICARADGKIIGAPARLYKGKDSVNSCMKADDMKPDHYSIRIRESLDYYDMSVTFNHDNNIALKQKKSKRKQSEKYFEFDNAYGPVSLALLIRSLPWQVGDERRFEVIDGNGRFLIVIRAVAEENVRVKAGTFKALRIEPSIFKMPSKRDRENAGYWARQQRKEKEKISLIKSFTMWMAKDPPRHFLKIRTDVYFGHVDMELKSYNTPPK